MTAKRFFILIDDEYEDTLPAIRDRTFKIKDIYGHYRYDNLEEICNELNRLNDENEQLKKELYRVYDDDYYLKQFIMAIVTVFSSGNSGLSKSRYELIVDACEMNKTSLKEFFK